MTSVPTFVVTLVRQEFDLKFRSTCQSCGESRILSAADGSLQEWQDGHKCSRPEPVPPAKPDLGGGAG